MKRKELQFLISAGVFSAALLSGAAYAEEPAADAAAPAAAAVEDSRASKKGAPVVSPGKTRVKHKKAMEKSVAKHTCAGKNECKGKGGCHSSDGGCAGKNTCKGKGGCATDGSMAH